jgi:hypothetical protein
MLEDSGERFDNGCTRIAPGPSERLKRAPLAPREAFLAAHGRLASLARVVRGRAFLVVAVDARGRVVESLCLEDRGALVIGRHTSAGLRLHAATVSLRHAAALACFEGDRPALRLWDLQSGAPFLAEDGEPNAAVLAEGPLYAAIDEYAVWFVPAGAALAGGAEAAWEALPPRTFLDRRTPAAPRTPAPTPVCEDGSEISRVTRLAPPLLFGEGDEPEIGWGELRVACGAHRDCRTVSAERLEQGVLIGRYHRCGLQIAGFDRISRVHLLLVRIGAEVWAIDTASTNGVQRGEAPLGAAVLCDIDTLTLAGQVTLEWRRAIHPDA